MRWYAGWSELTAKHTEDAEVCLASLNPVRVNGTFKQEH